ncbi:hypothetical protein AGMMS50233_10180 [Endomicrobiia bacterium]|nr:hypothetical protein AGMMS50233_10180 [Endomicrobiia bacterium]
MKSWRGDAFVRLFYELVKKWGMPGAVESILKFFSVIGLLALLVWLLMLLVWSVRPLREKIKKWEWDEKKWKEDINRHFVPLWKWFYKDRKSVGVVCVMWMIVPVLILYITWAIICLNDWGFTRQHKLFFTRQHKLRLHHKLRLPRTQRKTRESWTFEERVGNPELRGRPIRLENKDKPPKK